MRGRRCVCFVATWKRVAAEQLCPVSEPGCGPVVQGLRNHSLRLTSQDSVYHTQGSPSPCTVPRPSPLILFAVPVIKGRAEPRVTAKRGSSPLRLLPPRVRDRGLGEVLAFTATSLSLLGSQCGSVWAFLSRTRALRPSRAGLCLWCPLLRRPPPPARELSGCSLPPPDAVLSPLLSRPRPLACHPASPLYLCADGPLTTLSAVVRSLGIYSTTS